MSDLSLLGEYFKVTDQLIDQASKESIAECARLLAFNVAHYQSIYGELPLDDTLAMISMDKPNNEQVELMIKGLEILVGVLGNVVTGVGQSKH